MNNRPRGGDVTYCDSNGILAEGRELALVVMEVVTHNTLALEEAQEWSR